MRQAPRTNSFHVISMKTKFYLPLFIFFFLSTSIFSQAQDSTFIFKADSLNENGLFQLEKLNTWKFKEGNNPEWAQQHIDDSDWEVRKVYDKSINFLPESGVMEGWFRLNFVVDPSIDKNAVYLRISTRGAARAYLNGVEIMHTGNPSLDPAAYERGNDFLLPMNLLNLEEENLIALHYAEMNELLHKYTYMDLYSGVRLYLGTSKYFKFKLDTLNRNVKIASFVMGGMAVIFFLFALLYYINPDDKLIFWIFLFIGGWLIFLIDIYIPTYGIDLHLLIRLLATTIWYGVLCSFPLIITKMLLPYTRRVYYYFPLLIMFIALLLSLLYNHPLYSSNLSDFVLSITFLINFIAVLAIILKNKQKINFPFRAIIAGIILTFILFINKIIIIGIFKTPIPPSFDIFLTVLLLTTFPLSLLVYIALRNKGYLTELQKINEENEILSAQKLAIEQEKKEILERQNEELENQVAERTDNLTLAMDQLKASQEQLVQQEKLASLGQLTAGIAHEIKNPLNFVNNFSELSIELIDEVMEDLEEEPLKKKEIITDTLGDVKANLKLIHQHGTRADSIVMSMLQHSRGGTGKMEPTNLNSLVKEYVNLSFHGMRAGKKPINVILHLELDESLGQVPLIPEDFSRIILNLCNNAFDAMRDRTLDAAAPLDYTPKLSVRTMLGDNYFRLAIEDNGPGISMALQDKILQPFFTTKRGTEGTGLGLSITNDIITAHNGSLKIVSEEGKFTRFEIEIPYVMQLI